MIQEEKDLLFADICARLPYGVEVLSDIDQKFDGGWIGKLYNIGKHRGEWLFHLEASITPFTIEEIRPYLRPMSSMTEEEKKELASMAGANGFTNCVDATDYLYSKHFDVHSLIKKGLALEAPEGMYNIKL